MSSSLSTSRPGFEGLWIPLVTPFERGRLDLPSLTRLVGRLRNDGVDGFVACGSTGEAAALDGKEQLAVLDATLSAAGDVPVVMGVSGYHLPDMLEGVAELCTRPIAGLLVPAPHYIRPSQAGLLQWFRAIADASRVPLLVYDIPYRTGSVLALDTLLELCAHPNIRAVKDCGGDAGKTLALIADGRLSVLAGEDVNAFATVAQGGSGAIAASAHVRTRDFVRVLRCLREGRLGEARSLWASLVPVVQACFAEPNPAPVKAWLALAGEMGEGLRAPMTSCSSALRTRLADLNRP